MEVSAVEVVVGETIWVGTAVIERAETSVARIDESFMMKPRGI